VCLVLSATAFEAVFSFEHHPALGLPESSYLCLSNCISCNVCMCTLHIVAERETEEKTRQPETKLGASAHIRHQARLRKAKPNQKARNPHMGRKPGLNHLRRGPGKPAQGSCGKNWRHAARRVHHGSCPPYVYGSCTAARRWTTKHGASLHENGHENHAADDSHD
jgi:hypothetical protein